MGCGKAEWMTFSDHICNDGLFLRVVL